MATEEKKPIPCNCLGEMNERLQEHPEHNTQLQAMYAYQKGEDGVTRTGQARVVLQVETLDNTKRTRPVPVRASHCPFCGQKYDA